MPGVLLDLWIQVQKVTTKQELPFMRLHLGVKGMTRKRSVQEPWVGEEIPGKIKEWLLARKET